jgi:predicted dehydrogenase
VPISRILIVGLGSIGKLHLRLARELLPGADIRVLRHEKCRLIPEYANGCFSKLSHAIEFEPQLAVIASPATFHLSVAQPLAQAGVHLMVEKPLSASINNVPQLLQTCREKGTVLLTGYNLRFFPSLQKFRRLLSENIVGSALSVRAEIGQYLPSWRPGTDYRKSVSARSEFGGGVLLELSHEIDYLRWLFGEVEWVSAIQRKQSRLEIDVEDTAYLTMGFAHAPEATPLIAALNMDFVRHDTTRTCTVIGEAGSLRWNALTGTVELFEIGNSVWETLFTHQAQRDDSYLAEWRNFLGCIADKAAPFISGDDGLAVLRIIEAAKESSATGSIVALDHEDPECDKNRTIAI